MPRCSRRPFAKGVHSAGCLTLVASGPLKRAGRPEEIADAIVFAASAKASFITGKIIAVNGGRTAS
jgi:NAD(P)-dependent dehydrogenase (short-subunit alcohol dehydrogenase family)